MEVVVMIVEVVSLVVLLITITTQRREVGVCVSFSVTMTN